MAESRTADDGQRVGQMAMDRENRTDEYRSNAEYRVSSHYATAFNLKRCEH